MPESAFLRPAEIASVLGLTTGRVYQLAREGEIPFTRVGRSIRVPREAWEEWLRKRVGRWVQRYPQAEARVGGSLRLGDLVEEVLLNGFERYTRRPTAVPFSEWLDSLIDPSLKALLRHPDDERENVNMARTLRPAPSEPAPQVESRSP